MPLPRYESKPIRPVSTAGLEAKGQAIDADAFASIANNINSVLYAGYQQQSLICT